MKPVVTLTEAMTRPDLFGGTFAGPTFWTWRTVAKLIDGIPLTDGRYRLRARIPTPWVPRSHIVTSP
jgi:hypothetical protein